MDTAMPISPHDCNVCRAKIVEAIEGFDNNLEKNPTRIEFKCTINNEEFTDLRTTR